LDTEDIMRPLLLGMLLLCGVAVAGSSAASAAPANGHAINQVINSGSAVEPVHCRKYLPHRHSGAKPHGFGFGCGKAKRSARTKRA
jgi:hypothetical protein